MDPLSAISLAGVTCQFLGYGMKLVGTIRQVYSSSSSASEANEVLKLDPEEFRIFSERLIPTDRPQLSMPEGQDLAKFAEKCKNKANDILAKLDALKPQDQSSKPQRLWAAVRAMRKKVELEKDLTELEKYRNEFNQRLAAFNWSTMRDEIKYLQNNKTQGDVMGKVADMVQKIHLQMEKSARQSEALSSAADEWQEIINASKLSQETLTAIWQSSVLQRLRFDKMDERRKLVLEAYSNSGKQTFSWIFDDHDILDTRAPNRGATSFVRWLSSGTGIFHVTGKLGSAKSTLMKYVFQHRKTKEALDEWAHIEKRHAVLVSFLFWSEGVQELRSLDGLRQSLLHDILQQCPHLIPQVLRNAWYETVCASLQEPSKTSISQEDIRTGFNLLLETDVFFKHHCLCIFVDGLDEQDQQCHFEDHREMVSLLKSWVKGSQNQLKMCVSSREDTVFQQGFKDQPGLRLQDLTAADIEMFVSGRLQDMTELCQSDREDLCRAVLDQADGIFLWVHLVVVFLRNSCSGQDAKAMKRLVGHLPPQIELLLQHLFDKIEPAYSPQAHRTFKMVLGLQGEESSLSLLSWSFLDHYLEDPQFVLQDEFAPLDPWELPRHLENARTKLVNICRGIVVEVENESPTLDSSSKEWTESGSEKISQCSYKALAFTHRSVPQFIRNIITMLRLAELRAYRIRNDDKTQLSQYILDLLKLRFKHCLDEEPYDFLQCLQNAIHITTTCKGVVASDDLNPGKIWAALHYPPLLCPTLLLCRLGAFRYPTWFICQGLLDEAPVTARSRDTCKRFVQNARLIHSLPHLFAGSDEGLEYFKLILQEGIPPLFPSSLFNDAVDIYSIGDGKLPVPVHCDARGRQDVPDTLTYYNRAVYLYNPWPIFLWGLLLSLAPDPASVVGPGLSRALQALLEHDPKGNAAIHFRNDISTNSVHTNMSSFKNITVCCTHGSFTLSVTHVFFYLRKSKSAVEAIGDGEVTGWDCCGDFTLASLVAKWNFPNRLQLNRLLRGRALPPGHDHQGRNRRAGRRQGLQNWWIRFPIQFVISWVAGKVIRKGMDAVMESPTYGGLAHHIAAMMGGRYVLSITLIFIVS